MCIDASSAEEANEIFEERWRQKTGGGNAEPETQNAERLPVRTTKDIMRDCMTPAALEVKRRTQGIKG